MWLDFATSAGVDDKSRPVAAVTSSPRRKPRLIEYLETARAASAEKVMLSGEIPPATGEGHWLVGEIPGWSAQNLRLGSPANGTFRHEESGAEVMVRLVKEWFGDIPLEPAQAQAAWAAVAATLKDLTEDASMAYTPSRTGLNLWRLSVPRNQEISSVSSDIAEEIHATSGQGYSAHFVAGESFSQHEDCIPLIDPEATPTINAFADTDGRFMYAAVGKELGVGPAVRLKQDAASTMLFEEPFRRARYEVRFRVPSDWDTVGIFGVQHPNREQGWYHPNRPGATGVTWCDAAEATLALKHGWDVQPLQAVAFQKGNPMDTFFARVIRARERAAASKQWEPMVRRAVVAALRNILLQSVGAMASQGRTDTHLVESAREVPAGADMTRIGDRFMYETKDETRKGGEFYHPELAAQIWGRARARVLESPLGGPNSRGLKGGALHFPPHLIIGIHVDAIYTSHPPVWALPVGSAGGDDGKVGRLRLEGFLRGPLPTPVTLSERAALRIQSVEAGPKGAYWS